MTATPQPAPRLTPAVPPAPAAAATRLLVIHCSATPNGQWLGGAPGSGPSYRNPADVIDAWHAARGFQRSAAARSVLNWRLAHIGYHFVVDIDGTVWRGRHLREVGAHVAGFNTGSLGLCLVGGAEREARYTAAQWATLRTLTGDLCSQLKLPLAPMLYPRRDFGVCGHRDLGLDANGDGAITSRDWLKTCPGFDVAAWLGRGMEPLPEQIYNVNGGPSP